MSLEMTDPHTIQKIKTFNRSALGSSQGPEDRSGTFELSKGENDASNIREHPFFQESKFLSPTSVTNKMRAVTTALCPV